MNARVSTAWQRFWPKVDAKNPNQCWNWTGSRGTTGYGYFKATGRNVRAHRFMWEIANGPVPDGLQVLHHCDNPSCVNPGHLWLGTISDNIKDSFAKGRKNFAGERCPAARLTREQALFIRDHKEINPFALAKQFGVSKAHVRHIQAGNTWKCLGKRERTTQ